MTKAIKISVTLFAFFWFFGIWDATLRVASHGGVDAFAIPGAIACLSVIVFLFVAMMWRGQFDR